MSHLILDDFLLPDSETLGEFSFFDEAVLSDKERFMPMQERYADASQKAASSKWRIPSHSMSVM